MADPRSLEIYAVARLRLGIALRVWPSLPGVLAGEASVILTVAE